MKLVINRLGSSPKIPPKCLEHNLFPAHLPLVGPNAHDVEGGHLVNTMLVVEVPYPLIDPGELILPVHIARRTRPIVWEPGQLWRKQEGRDGKGAALS